MDDTEQLALAWAKMVTEAHAARDKYGAILSPKEDFLLEAECEAIADRAMRSDPKVLELGRQAIATRIYELFGDKEEWSDEKKIEEFLKLHPKTQ